MSKAEDFIKENTRKCSEGVRPFKEWITPDNALKAVEIAREEVIEKATKWIGSHLLTASIGQRYIEDFKEYMKDETD